MDGVYTVVPGLRRTPLEVIEFIWRERRTTPVTEEGRYRGWFFYSRLAGEIQLFSPAFLISDQQPFGQRYVE